MTKSTDQTAVLGLLAAHDEAAEDRVAHARKMVKTLARKTDGPILVGPWHSEVGYELMMWVPFLTWAVEEHPELAGRLLVISRGGARQWYEHLGLAGYADLYDLYAPDELRARLDEAAEAETGGLRKQMAATAFDRVLLGRVAAEHGLEGAPVLHPSLMYRAYWQLVLKQHGIDKLARLFTHRRMVAPDLGPLAGVLPERYTAVRFYFRASFDASDEHVAFARRSVERLAERGPVVLLNPAIAFDDHVDFDTAGDRVVRLDEHMTPTNNLALQTIAVSRAEAYVGTYGGLSYVAPFYGVPSLSFHSTADQMIRRHLDLAGAIFSAPELGDYVVLPRDAMGLINLVAALTADVA